MKLYHVIIFWGILLIIGTAGACDINLVSLAAAIRQCLTGALLIFAGYGWKKYMKYLSAHKLCKNRISHATKAHNDNTACA